MPKSHFSTPSAIAESETPSTGQSKTMNSLLVLGMKLWVTITKMGPGFLLAVVIAVAATYIGHLVPVIGAPIAAIVIGIVLRLTMGMPERARPGTSFTAKRILQFAIILLGAGLSLKTVWHTGVSSFWVMVVSLLTAIIGGHLIGRLLKLPRNLTSLISVGTAICGASAISAVSPILAAEEGEIAYAISTIFLFNIIAVFLFPFLGHVFHFSSSQFGVWAGTAINDTSSVVAAGYAFSHAAGQYATIVKLTRSMAIIPVSLWFALRSVWTRKEKMNIRSIRFPMFILGFVLMSACATVGVFNHQTGAVISGFGQFFVATALAAIGLNTETGHITKTGYRPLLMGLCTWALVAVSSLVVQHFA